MDPIPNHDRADWDRYYRVHLTGPDGFEPAFLRNLLAIADDDTEDPIFTDAWDREPADIPMWFRGQHGHDRYKYEKNKKLKPNDRPDHPTPATVVFSWKLSASREPIVFGSFDDNASMCRARPNSMLQYMNFDIDVREGQVHGTNSVDARVKDKLLFDPSTAKRMEFEIVDTLPDDIVAMLGEANAGASSQNHPFAIMKYTVGKERPVREFGQVEQYTPGSVQEAFFAEKPRYYTIICKLATEPQRKTWQVYDELFNCVRRLSVNGLPTADWFYSHDANYTKEYTRYISKVNTTVPNLPWLLTEHGTYRAVHPTSEGLAINNKSLPVGAFSSVQDYCRHNLPAVLKDREEDMRQVTALLNPGRSHTVLFVYGNERRSVCHIHINTLDYIGGLNVPFTGTKVTVRLTDLADAYDNGVEITGTVWGAKRDGYDFMINATPNPEVLENMRRVRPRGINGVWAATIDITYTNSDYQLKLDNLRIMMVNGLPKQQDVTALPIKDGRHRGMFELRSIICEFRPEIYPPAFRPEFRDGSAPGKVRTLQIVDELINLAGLDREQARLIRVCIDEGVPGNTAILQGRPGSGKSASIGYLIIILMLFGQKVVATGQANAAPRALLDKVRQVIAKHERQIPELSALGSRITRLNSPRREQFNMSNLAVNIKHHEIQPDCMAARVREYLHAHPQERDVVDFERHVAAQDAGQTYNPPGLNKGLTAVLARLHAKICDTMLLVAPTTFASSALAHIDYFADVIAIDEAAQATEPDAINVLLEQTKVKLVLLAGDVKQLPPVVKSLQARSNPWATILAVSVMRRLLSAYPGITNLELTYNYRSHPQLVHMAARIFYDDKMYCGVHPPGYWATPLDQILLRLMRNARIFPQDHRRIRDHRQIFYAYEGLPVPETDGTSLSNPTGVECIAQKTRMLLEAGVKPEQVGIITFYKEDKRCIRGALAALNIDVEVDVETSTVEAFLGREKEIVLIHFVVANDDEDNPFGFVCNPERLCVATTRAKRAQLMFGNIKFWRPWQRKPSSRSKEKRYKEMFQICDWVQSRDQVVEWNRIRAGGQVVVGGDNQRRVDDGDVDGVDELDDDFQ